MTGASGIDLAVVRVSAEAKRAAISRPEAAAEIGSLLADLAGLPRRPASVSGLPASHRRRRLGALNAGDAGALDIPCGDATAVLIADLAARRAGLPGEQLQSTSVT